jgi:hypothetical protein
MLIRVTAIALIFTGAIGTTFSQGPQTSETKVNIKEQLLVVLSAAKAKRYSVDVAPQFIVQLPEFGVLEQYVASNWENTLLLSQQMKSNYDASMILSYSFEGLSAEKYLKYTENVVDLYAQDNLPKSQFVEAIVPSQKKVGFYAINYDNPQVQDILKKAKSLAQNDIGLTQTIDGILNGKSKAAFDQFYKTHTTVTKPILSQLVDKDAQTPSIEPSQQAKNLQTPYSLARQPATVESSSNWFLILASAAAVALAIVVIFRFRKK